MSISYKDKLLYKKPPISYPESVEKVIALISFRPKGADVFGSFQYRMQKYAGDIDLLERIHYTKEITVIQQFIKALKRIIKGLKTDHYFSEFKAGIDHEFDFSIGELKNGIYVPNPQLRSILEEKYQKKLITDDEYNYIIIILDNLNSIPFSKKSMAYDSIFSLIREKKILRWTKEEILRGYKMLRNEKYTLAQALRDKTIVKIDLIVLINNKFVEVTNILSLAYIDPSGLLIPINIDDKDLHSVEGLQAEVEKLYYSNKYYSPLKMCKRMYALCRATKNYIYLENISIILRGDISLLYQIKSEIEAFLILLERVKTPPLKQIDNQLSEIKGRLSYDLDIRTEDLIYISEEINKIIKLKSAESKLQALKKYNTQIKYIIESQTIDVMNKVGLNPPPGFFLPDKAKYARDIKRTITERPTLEFKLFEENILEYILLEEQQQKFSKEVKTQFQRNRIIKKIK